MPTRRPTHDRPVIKPFYDRLRAKGYKPKYALTACMRKLLALLCDGLTWQQIDVAKIAGRIVQKTLDL